jgi:hypothetical protein
MNEKNTFWEKNQKTVKKKYQQIKISKKIFYFESFNKKCSCKRRKNVY